MIFYLLVFIKKYVQRSIVYFVLFGMYWEFMYTLNVRQEMHKFNIMIVRRAFRTKISRITSKALNGARWVSNVLCYDIFWWNWLTRRILMVDEISENVLKRGCLVKNVVLKTDILIVTFLQCNFCLGVHAFL